MCPMQRIRGVVGFYPAIDFGRCGMLRFAQVGRVEWFGHRAKRDLVTGDISCLTAHTAKDG